MATRSLGSLTLDLIARIGGFQQGMDQAARVTDKRMKEISASAVKAGKMVGAGLAAGVAAGATALTSMAVSAVDTAAEISKLASIANVSNTDFQRLAAGSQAVGIEQDKLADILKDVNDKVGDFLNTGGGGMKDFFDQIAPKVGVTADQFRNLSGSQALGLYVSSLEKAKVSQSDMTFFMEAIANDATALLPLLRNNAEGFKRFGDAAEAAGAIMDDKTIRAAQELQAATWLIGNSATGVGNEIKAALLPMLSSFAGKLTDVTENGVLVKKIADDLADSVKVLGKMAVASAGGLHIFLASVKGLHDLDNAMVGGGDAKWYDRFLPPVRVYNAVKNFGAIGDTFNKSKDDIKGLIAMYGELWDGIDKPPGGKTKNQVQELADMLEQLRNGGIGTFRATTPGQQQAAKQLESTLKTAASGYAQLKQQYDPAGAAVDDFKEKTAQLALLMRNSKITQQEYAQGTEWIARGFNEAIQASSGLVEKMKYQAELEKGLANQRDQYQLAADSIGMGSKEAGRYQQRLQLEQENNEKILGLRTELATTSDTLRRRDLENQIALIEEYQPKQLKAMQEGWTMIDLAQSDWMNGLSSAWADYADNATNFAAMTADATSTVLGSARSELGSFLSDITTGSADASDALMNMVAGFGKSLVDALADMAAQWLIYQGVQLMVGKTTQASAIPALVGNAQATSFQAQLAAFASTAAIPIVGPALAPGAAMAAAMATAPMVAGVASSALMGMAHDGIDSVPREGTWLLQKGERVTTAATSAKLDRTLDEVNRSNEGGKQAADSRPAATLVFNVNGDVSPQTVAMIEQMGVRVAKSLYQDIDRNGPLLQKIRKKI